MSVVVLHCSTVTVVSPVQNKNHCSGHTDAMVGVVPNKIRRTERKGWGVERCPVTAIKSIDRSLRSSEEK